MENCTILFLQEEQCSTVRGASKGGCTEGSLMIKLKLTILNMKEFLHAVNECTGEIAVLTPDGKTENINKQYARQEKLWEAYRENRNSLPLLLTVSDGKDYLRLVNYYAGDC